MNSGLPRQGGFTLIELLITLMIFTLLAGAVSFSWSRLIATNEHTQTVNQTQRIFALARSFAVNQKTLTTICPLSPPNGCVDDWNQPVSIFPDENNDRQPDNGRIHKTFSLAKPRTTLYSRTAGRGYFQMSADGMSHGTMGSIVTCSNGGNGSTRLTYLALNIAGRVRTLQDEDHDGKLKLPWGTEISCP